MSKRAEYAKFYRGFDLTKPERASLVDAMIKERKKKGLPDEPRAITRNRINRYISTGKQQVNPPKSFVTLAQKVVAKSRLVKSKESPGADNKKSLVWSWAIEDSEGLSHCSACEDDEICSQYSTIDGFMETLEGAISRANRMILESDANLYTRLVAIDIYFRPPGFYRVPRQLNKKDRLKGIEKPYTVRSYRKTSYQILLTVCIPHSEQAVKK